MQFTFKREAVAMAIFLLAPTLLGLFVVFVLMPFLR
jgi:hypothetical protein